MASHLLILCCIGLVACIESRQFINLHDWDNFLNASQRSVFIQPDGSTSVHHLHKEKLGIVNGRPAAPGQFCYVNYLRFTDGDNVWACTGSLIKPNVVLTAAHCVDGATRGAVLLGSTDLTRSNEPGRQIYRFDQTGMHGHENYDKETIRNDIAIITLPQNATLTKYVCTVKIPEGSPKKKPATGSNKDTISGYGKTSDRTTTTKLMYAEVNQLYQPACRAFYRQFLNYIIADSQLCIDGADGKSTCLGDSGGPLVTDGVQKGIVSFGINSCEAGAPSVFTRTASYAKWLSDKL